MNINSYAVQAHVTQHQAAARQHAARARALRNSRAESPSSPRSLALPKAKWRLFRFGLTAQPRPA
jgi:hypothetical protein